MGFSHHYTFSASPWERKAKVFFSLSISLSKCFDLLLVWFMVRVVCSLLYLWFHIVYQLILISVKKLKNETLHEEEVEVKDNTSNTMSESQQKAREHVQQLQRLQEKVRTHIHTCRIYIIWKFICIIINIFYCCLYFSLLLLSYFEKHIPIWIFPFVINNFITWIRPFFW